MRMHGLPQGLVSPPRPVAPEDEARLEERGWLGQAPGTMVLVLIFLAAFVLYFFTNWKLLSLVWKIG